MTTEPSELGAVQNPTYAVEVDSDSNTSRIKPFELTFNAALRKICCLICFTYPILIIFVAAVLSVPLTYFAEWPPEESFFELLVELSNAGADSVVSDDLGRENALTSTAGAFVIVVLSGFVSLGLFGCLLGLFSGGPLDFPFLKKTVEFHYKLTGKPAAKQILPVDVVLADQEDKKAKDDLLRDNYQFYSAHVFPEPDSPEYDSFMTVHSYMLGGFCCIVFPLIGLVISVFFGAIIAIAEDEWSFASGYYTVFQEILDLEIKLVDPPTASRFGTKMTICLVAVWANGYFFILLGFLSGPLLIPFVRKLEFENKRIQESMEDDSKTQLAKDIAYVSCIGLPLAIFVFSIIFGIMLAIISPFTLGESISEAMSEITNMKSDIRDLDPSEITGFTRFFLILIGLFGLAFFALTLGMFSYMFTGRIARALKLEPDYSKVHVVRNSIKKLVVFIMVGIPIIAVMISAVFGSILAAVESAAEGDLDVAGESKWNVKVGFFVVLSELLNINIELYEVPQTEHGFGKLLLAIIGALSYSLFTLTLAVVGGPVLIPVVHYFAGTAYKVPDDR